MFNSKSVIVVPLTEREKEKGHWRNQVADLYPLEATQQSFEKVISILRDLQNAIHRQGWVDSEQEFALDHLLYLLRDLTLYEKERAR